MEENVVDKQKSKHKLFTIIGIVICVLLLPILIINITMIIDSYIHKNEAPSFGKYTPFIVQSGSMSGTIESGDLIITTKIDSKDVKIGDIISFYNPNKSGESIVTHRVLLIDNNSDEITFTTVGDVVYNETIAKYGSFEEIPETVLEAIVEVVPEEKLISLYKFRIPFVGNISIFMSTITGLIVCVLVPLLLIVGYDLYKRKINEKNNKEDMELLLAELEELRAQKAIIENEATKEVVSENNKE